LLQQPQNHLGILRVVLVPGVEDGFVVTH
jgi:hypothetical protein